jgi:hypothetical protein
MIAMTENTFEETAQDGLAEAPALGTAAWLDWVLELREQAWQEGMPHFTIDEGLRALERERAGYDGLGELWGCTPTSIRA